MLLLSNFFWMLITSHASFRALWTALRTCFIWIVVAFAFSREILSCFGEVRLEIYVGEVVFEGSQMHDMVGFWEVFAGWLFGFCGDLGMGGCGSDWIRIINGADWVLDFEWMVEIGTLAVLWCAFCFRFLEIEVNFIVRYVCCCWPSSTMTPRLEALATLWYFGQ